MKPPEDNGSTTQEFTGTPGPRRVWYQIGVGGWGAGVEGPETPRTDESRTNRGLGLNPHTERCGDKTTSYTLIGKVVGVSVPE